MGSRKPLFCAHPLGGTALCYFDLARQLDADQPFYAIRAPELTGEHDPLERIEDMAAYYVSAVRTVQPVGPYLLGGWSMGGVVAFEMARQLHRMGSFVALVALLDAWAPGSVSAGEDDDTTLLARLATDLNIPFSDAALREISPNEQLDFVVKQATHDAQDAVLVRGAVSRYWDTCRRHKQALRAYRPGVYPGFLTLFRTTSHSADMATAGARGWDELAAGGVQVHDVPGTHQTVMAEPCVRTLAQELQRCIESALRSFENGYQGLQPTSDSGPPGPDHELEAAKVP
jgi:thioesterase domain-containing protein